MTQEQIKRAANSYIDDFLYNHIDYTVIHDNYETGRNNAICEFGPDIFKAGAQWRINSVWHDASEQPRRNTWYIAQIGDSAFDTFTDSANWKSYAKGLNIICWAYIEDLLPNKED